MKAFPAEIPIFLRENQNRIYSTFPYYMTKFLSDVFFKIFDHEK